jgi:NAD(P)-dependent dehydrogenase (short-subunit alcohol dehydrogenase family)
LDGPLKGRLEWLLKEKDKMEKNILITGSSQRIGRELCLYFASMGWNVGIHYNKSKKDALNLKKKIEDYGVKCICIQNNLLNIGKVKEILTAAKKGLGDINCIVNNASIFNNDDILNFTEKSWNEHIKINLLAPAILIKEFSKIKNSCKNKSIINILDQRIFKLTPYFFSYTVSKTALHTITKTSAMKLAPSIRVNGIAPGPVLKNKRQTQKHFNKQSKNTLLNKSVKIEDICKTAYLLANSETITGQVIAVDSGQSLNWKTPDIIGGNE